MTNLKEFVGKIKSDQPQNVVKIYFPANQTVTHQSI